MRTAILKTRAKSTARKITDRVLSPYFDRQSAQIASLAAAIERPAPHDEVLTDFNLLLHTLRTVELARMARADKVLLSVGCSDRSYFDWVEGGHGPVAEHWGVELYRPRPTDLPPHVRWIEASAAHMPQVPDDSVDVLFSGQNIEHLSAEDIVGFLLESRRVLRDGGTLVIDSPNRLVTEPYAWRHPEHVVELSPEEAADLLGVAGFATTSLRGYWLCENDDGELLPLLPAPDDAAEFLRRSVLAIDRPDESFCWWLEATPTSDAVDSERLRAHVEALVASLWDHRVNRGAFSPAPESGGAYQLPAGTTGTVYRAGPIPLFPGSVTVTPVGTNLEDVTIRLLAEDGSPFAESVGVLRTGIDDTQFGVWVDLSWSEPTSRAAIVERVLVRPEPA